MKHISTFFLTLITTFSFGQQLFKDSFPYGEKTFLTANGWTAHSGTGTNAMSVGAGLTYTGIASDGNAALIGTSGEDVNKAMSQSVNSGVVYTSFLINVSAAQDAGDYFFHLGPKDLGTTFRGKVFIKKNGAGFSVGVTKSSNTANYTTAIYDFNKTYSVVLKYTFKTASTTDDEVVLFVNPTIETEPSTASATSPTGELDSENIGTVALRQGNASNAPTLRLDEIRVGLTWADVMQAANGVSVVLNNLPLSLNKIVNQTPTAQKIDITGNNLEADIEILAEDEKTFEVSTDNKTWASIISLKAVNQQINESFYVRISEKLNTVQTGKQNLIVRYKTNQKVLSTNAINYQISEVIVGFPKIIDVKKLAEQTTVNIAGRVTSAGEINNLLYVQDATAGIPVSGTIANLKIGDSVQVVGKLANLSKQLYIVGSEIKKIGTTSVILSPKTISLNQLSANEGNLISVANVKFTDLNFVFLPNSNYTLTDGTTNSVVRVWDGTDVDGRTKPQSNFTISGVVGRFNDTYQIYPRMQADVPTSQPFTNPTADVSTDKTLDVVTWNIEWFGSTGNGPSDEALQLNNVKRTIDSLKADLFVLVEVSNPTAFDNLLTRIPNYKGVCSTAFSAGATANDAQRVCFVYKTTDLSLVSTKILLKNTTPINIYPDSFDRFWASGRLPFLGTFDVNISGAKSRVNVVGIHARANTGSDGATREKIFQQRKIDVEVLKDSLDKYFEKDAIIIAGDFNDDLDENVIVGISTTNSSYKKFVDDSQNWLPITKNLSDKNYRSYITESNVIDHIMISNELKDMYLKNSETIALPFTYIPNYLNTTSDHLPILTRFRLDAFVLANEANNKTSAYVYPNPTEGNFDLNIEETLKSKDCSYNLLNQKGQVVFGTSGKWNDLKEKLNSELKEKTAGIYYLKISDSNIQRVLKISLQN